MWKYFLEKLKRAENRQFIIEKDFGKIILINQDTSSTTNIRVLLDAGALVLHKSNRDFAEAWLSARSEEDIEACIFRPEW